MNIKDIGAALRTLLKADPKVVEGILADQALQKAAQGLSESEMVVDRWESGQMHQGVTKEQVKTGPSVAASGDGAAKMVERYSETTAQHGTTLTAESLARLLGPINTSMKAVLEIIEGHGKVLKALLKASEKEDEEDEEESEVVEINASKAKSFFRKAKRLVSKAEDEDDKKAAKALKSEAKKQFALARGHARLAGDLTLDKTIKATALEAGIKADVEVVQEEEEDEEEEKSKSMQDKEAEAKAKADADAKVKSEADAAAAKAKADADAAEAAKGKTTVTAEDLKKALDGVAMLHTTVQGLMSVMAGQSKLAVEPPTFVKSGTAQHSAVLRDQIDEMEDGGGLSAADAVAAREILDKTEAVRAGRLDASFVTGRLMKSSTAVQALFNTLPELKVA